MNGLTIIYIIGALAVGFLFGMILELIIDSKTIRELQEDNHRLRLLNEQISAEKNVEIIEINDNRAQPESYFTPF